MDDLNENEIFENENLEGINTKKGINLKLILGAIGGIAVLGIIVLCIFMFSSLKFRYFSLIKSGFDSVIDMGQDLKKSPFGGLLNMNFENKFAMDTEVGVNVETSDPEILEWLNGFKSGKLIVNEKSDYENGYFGSDIKVILNDNEFILADLVRKNDIFSVNVQGITDGYISVDNNRLAELWDKIGYDGPDKFTSQIEMINEFKLPDNDVKALGKSLSRMGKVFTNAFGNEDFSSGKGTIKYNEKTIEANYIDFKMNSSKMNNGIVFAMEQLLKEDEAIDILLKLLTAYHNSAIQQGYDVTPFTREELVEAINDMLNDVKLLEFAEDEGMVIRLYYEGNDIIKIDIFSLNYTSNILTFVMIDDGREKYYEYSTELQKCVDNAYMAEKDIWTHTIDVDYINYETGEVLEEYGERYILTMDNSSDDELKIKITDEVGLVEYDISGKINGNESVVKVSTNIKDEKSSCSVDVKFSLLENAKFDEKAVNNAFDASNASDEELINKQNKVAKKWNDFSSTNSENISRLYSAISILLGSV